jgi:hypothetical protein
MNVVSIPIAAHSDKFRWQLDLFWYAHQRIYGAEAASRAHAVLVNCNHATAERITTMPWGIDVPHTVCTSVFDWPRIGELRPDGHGMALPLNIQLGLEQILSKFDDEQVIELNDCDMFHFRPFPDIAIPHGQLIVSAIYENWHLHSLGKYKHVIERYFENGGRHYNGGFVPIVGTVATFKRIMPEWIAVHLDILKQPYPSTLLWWAGMYALQAACEKARVDMIDRDSCYVPEINQISDRHYIGHYSVDKRFDKRKYPAINRSAFEKNLYYDLISAWMDERSHALRVPSVPALA